MSDDDEKAELALSTPEARERFAMRLAGQLPANECRFKCVTCEFDQTMQFEDDEMEVLDQDVRSYTGPCPKCGKMTLLPFDRMFDDGQGGVLSQARESRRREYEEQADVLLDKVEGRVVKVFGGGAVAPPVAPTNPGERDDLPPSSTVDLSDLQGRRGE